ncbi:PRC-barrel domain-containing protein [Candidatus Peregrinibacteria bacterium]|nr:PRC-barrel domain-containing protein [Candidatus Peregrinibacteria bacterium]
MVKDFKSMVGSRVLEYDSGDLLGMVSDIVIDPDSGMVEAFWVRPATLPFGNAILRTSDVLELKKHIYIRSDKVLAQAEDVIRINEILEDGRKFLGCLVQSEAGQSYGRCIDLSFDTDTYALKQIYTRKSLLGLITLDERLFSYENIIKVLPNLILINDDAKKKEGVIVTTPEAAAS